MDDTTLPPLPRMTHYGGTAVVLSAAELRARDAEVARAAIAADRAKGGEAVAYIQHHDEAHVGDDLVWGLGRDGRHTPLFTRPSPAPTQAAQDAQDAEQSALRAAEAALLPLAQACSSCKNDAEDEFCCRKEQWDAIHIIRAAMKREGAK